MAAAKATHMVALDAARTPDVTLAVTVAPLFIVSEPGASSAAPVGNLVAPLPIQNIHEVAAVKWQHDWNADKAATDLTNLRN